MTYALMSPCGDYRYLLGRSLPITELTGTKPRALLFVMLNPSTADAEDDDPTIRRCVDFAKQWHFNQLLVANLYAWRATDPAELWRLPQETRIGPETDDILRTQRHMAHTIVCAWGALGGRPEAVHRADQVRRLFSINRTIFHLGTNQDDQPKHPLYLPKDTMMRGWEGPRSNLG